ncbi:MAG TPA: SPFH domain-containing protein, partial [Thermoanaerobaculia bacterium]|nr:SPFH domain-containing protein [Thermoanaerobaculia bacterium]
MIREREFHGRSGFGALFVFLLLIFGSIALLIFAINRVMVPLIVLAPLVLLASVVGLCGLFMVNPNQAKVLQLFGDYVGTSRRAGLRWANPFYSKKGVSVRTRNFETGKLKVNDNSGNPIEIAAVVVWRVVD